jgi:ferric enterobactin receptor
VLFFFLPIPYLHLVKAHHLLSFLFLFAFSMGSAQDVLLPRDFEEETVTEILKVIKKHHNARLAYDVTSLRNIERSVTIQGDDLEEDLRVLLEDTGFEFKLLRTTYLIIPRPKPNVSVQKVQKRNFALHGRVRDLVTGEVLPFASLSIAGTSLGTTTQMDGSFHLGGISADTMNICASYLGYRALCMHLGTLSADKEVQFFLERNNTFLPAVEIKGAKDKGIRLMEHGQLMEIEPSMLSRITVNGQPDLFKAVQFLPGVSSGDGLDASLNIRGSEDDENLILWDGFKIYHQNHFFGVFSTLNPNAIQNIQVHKGAYPSRYGGRSGGVLEVTGRNADFQKAKVQVGLDLIGHDISVESPLSNSSSLLIDFRRSHSDYSGSPLFKNLLDRVYQQSVAKDPSFSLNFSNNDPNFYYYDLHLKFHTELSKTDQLNISLFNGRDFYSNTSHNQYFAQDGTPSELNDYFFDDSNWGNTGAGATWSHRMKKGRFMHSSLGYSSYRSSYFFSEEERDFLNGNPLAQKFSSTLLQNDLEDISFEHRQVFPGNKGSTELGYSFNYVQLNYTESDRLLVEGVSLLNDSTVSTSNHAIYLDRKFQFNTAWFLDLGLRMTANTYANRLYGEPRALLSHRLSEALSWRVGGGNYVQTIRRSSKQNLFLRQADQWVLSTRDLVPESRTFQGILGVNWKKGPWLLDVEGFYKKTRGALLNQNQIRFVTAYSNGTQGLVTGKSEVLGVDVLLAYQKKGHDLWIAYSYTASFNYFSTINEGRAFSSAFNKPNDLKIIYAYSYLDYIFSTDLVYSSGYAYTPILGTFQNDLTGRTFIIYGDDLSARLPDFFRWDLSVQRKFYGERCEWTVGLGVYNLSNHKNVRSRQYAVDQLRPNESEELTISAIDLELMGLTPNFILKFSFQ